MTTYEKRLIIRHCDRCGHEAEDNSEAGWFRIEVTDLRDGTRLSDTEHGAECAEIIARALGVGSGNGLFQRLGEEAQAAASSG